MTVKRIVAIILLCCLFFTIIGYHFVFRLHLREIRAEMKQRLLHAPSNDVMVMTFDREERSKIEWEDEHEFRYMDEMYDVIEQHEEGNRLIIRCLPDKKEKILLEAYKNMAQKNASSPGQASLIKLLTTQFIASANVFLNRPQKELKVEFFNYSAHLPTIAGRALKHPPEFC